MFLKTPEKEILEIIEIIGCRANFLVYDKNGKPDCGATHSMNVAGFAGCKVIAPPAWSGKS